MVTSRGRAAVNELRTSRQRWHGQGPRVFALLCLLALAIVSLDAGANAKASKLYEDALARYERNDSAGAIIQLKNALQQDPRMLAAQLLLGKAQLAAGDAPAAEDAFARALDLGVDRAEIAIPLAEALYSQGKYQQLLDRVAPEWVSGPGRAQVLLLRGQSHRSMRDVDGASIAFRAARAADPQLTAPILALAELDDRRGRRAEASRLVTEAVAVAPKDPKVWYLKGQIALSAGDVKEALAAFDRSLAIDKAGLDARIARASLLIALVRNAEAAPDIEYLTKEQPNDPRGNYVRALYLSALGDVQGTRQALVSATEFVDATKRDSVRLRAPELLLIAGLAHLGLNQTEKARSYLEDYLKIDPGQPVARKALGAVLLSKNDYRSALSTLEIAEKAAPQDTQTLAMLAAAHMGLKQYSTSTAYLERALKASGGSPGVHATLGLSLIGAGDQSLGITHLRQALEKDPSQVRAGVALAILYLRRGEAGKAVQVASQIAKREPGNVMLANLLGVTRAAAADPAAARQAYEAATRIDPTFMPAQLNLVRLDVNEGKFQAARDRLTMAQTARPKDAQILYELALLEERSGRPVEAIAALERAHAMDGRNLAVSQRLVELHIRNRAPDRALDVAKGAEGFAAGEFSVQATLGRAYLAAGQQKNAQAVFTRMSRLALLDPPALTEIARYQLEAGDLSGATYSLDKALAESPDYGPALAVLTEIDLIKGDIASAERRAKALAAKPSSYAIGYRLLGDIAFSRRKFAESAVVYAASLARDPRMDTAMRLHGVYLESGKPAKADEVMESWLKARPDDAFAMVALGESRLRSNDLSGARTWFERALKLHSEDPALLNNYASVLARQNDPAALKVAEQAHRLAPANGEIQDTLGWIMVQRGDLGEGLRHLREARLRSPDNPEIRYHLAVALSQAGRKPEAKSELQAALRQEIPFEGRTAAITLLKDLAVP